MVLALEEVLKDAIKPYSFYASEYPLILSIENHCSKKQQDRMAEHFKNILGKEIHEYFLFIILKRCIQSRTATVAVLDLVIHYTRG